MAAERRDDRGGVLLELRARAEDNGAMLAGHVNTEHIRRLLLDANRTAVTRDQLLFDHTSGVLGVESRPGGPVYFSDFTSIYKLTLVG